MALLDTLSRRKFFGASLLAPLAAKAAADNAVAEMAGINTRGLGANPYFTGVPAVPGGIDLGDPKIQALRSLGLCPEWLTETVQRDAIWAARTLPMDLASLRSVSVSAKFFMARTREEEKAWTHAARQYAMNQAREEFYQTFFQGSVSSASAFKSSR